MIKEWPDEEAGPRGSRRPWEAPSIAPGARWRGSLGPRGRCRHFRCTPAKAMADRTVRCRCGRAQPVRL